MLYTMPLESKINKLTLTQKSEILEKLKKGAAVNTICNEYKVHKSTVTRIKQKGNLIREYITNIEPVSGTGQRHTLKVCKYPRMECALYKWFCNQRKWNIPISVEVIKTKACELHAKIKEEPGSFNASNGWMTNFKKRYGIRHLKIGGEKSSNKPCPVNAFLTNVTEEVEQLTIVPDQIHNVDEDELFIDANDTDQCIKVENLDDCDDCIDEVELTETSPPQKIKASSVIQSFNNCIQWAEENQLPIKDILKLREIQEKVKSRVGWEKQLSGPNMFKKS